MKINRKTTTTRKTILLLILITFIGTPPKKTKKYFINTNSNIFITFKENIVFINDLLILG